ncbi:MAG: sugar phosphate nucleotidyltransferase [Hydrotalea sp.]|nr:sugar phosphate nucleotidyltransferase [Hydrotalea sp.]
MTRPNIIAIIPAAGRGTRLLPFTRYFPKEMMPLGDRPIIHYTIEEIQEAGIEKIILITNREKQSIADYLFHHANLGLDKNNLLLVNQEEQKGLGHAVLCAMPHIEKHITQVAVIAPDDVMARKSKNDSLAIKQLCNASTTDNNAMWVAVEKIKPADSKKYGVLNIVDSQQQNGQTIYQASDLVEKPSAVDAPSDVGIIARYVLPLAIFASLQKTAPGAGGEIQLTDGMKNLLPAHRFFGVESNLMRLDTGNVEGLFNANYFHRYHDLPPKK